MMNTPQPGAPMPTQASRGADGLLAAVEYLLAALLAFSLLIAPILGALVGPADSDDPSTDETGSGSGVDDLLNAADEVATPVAVLFFLTLGFQVIQASYPWIVSRRRGRTIESDWRFVSKLPDDIGAGLILALGCFFGAQIATVGAGRLVGLENTDDASNTDILTDNQGSIWIIGVILLVVVGAPLAEELLFRGLILRTLQKYFGPIFAIIVSSIVFAIPHWQPDATWQETVVLLAALAVVGLILAIGAVVTDRLGPSVIAHFFFNLTGTLLTLL